MTKYLCILYGLVLMQGCLRDDSEIASIRDASMDVTLIVEIPETQAPPSRSMDGTQENHINEVDILVFGVDDSDPYNVVETFREHVRGDVVHNSVVDQAYKVELKARLTATANSRVVIVANAGAQVASALWGLSAGAPKKTVLEQLRYTSGPWAAGGTVGSFQPIPMYGETGKVSVTFGAKFGGIQLRRMVARIDVANREERFTLEKIYLCNYNTAGYIAPKWRTSDGQIVSLADPNVPSDPGKHSGAAVYTPASQIMEGEIYTFESAAADDADESTRRNATCLVIEGRYEGEKSFYRVDFTYDTTPEGEPVRYMPLLRNYKYQVSIISATGRGYATFEEALASYTVVSNLKTRILSYDMGVIKDINFNGQNMLGVSQTDYVISSSAAHTPSDINKLSVFTDYAPGWVAEKIEDGTGGPASWLTLSAMGGAGGVISNVYLLFDENPGPERLACITLKAGRLTHRINVLQPAQPPIAE